MIYTVYQTTNNVNGKIYIGVHKTLNPNDAYLGSGKALRHALKMYGTENFSKQILFSFDNLIDAYQKENELVNESFIKREDTYNMVCGGSISPDGSKNTATRLGENSSSWGKRHSEETKKKISQANIGKVITPETRKKISESNKGKVSPNKGKRLSAEDKAKKSIAALSRNKMKCPHCGKEVDPGNYSRFHGDQCSSSPNFTEELRLERSIRNSVTGRKLISKTCPHCSTIGSGGNMSRYHFDNCKLITGK